MKPVTPRDVCRQFWVQSTKPELEGKLGTTFALSNGLLGLRGAHEECPAWGRPEFYVAGTYAGGPATLLGFHDPDHVLTHPARITPEALAALRLDVIWTLPNLPFPVAESCSATPPDADGVIEEFDGFLKLDPDLDGVCESYCRHTQAVKQPDVLAAFSRFEELYPLEIRRRNWLFYNARTLHGSSLSLPGMAYAAARCGLNDAALYNLHKSARMDLDDVNLDTERGVHVSGAAVAWQALVFGFGGLTPTRECLHFRPNLPRQWEFLRFTVHWQFQRLRVELTPDAITFIADPANTGPVAVRVGDGRRVQVKPGAERRVWR